MSYEYELVRHGDAAAANLFLISMNRRLYHWHGDIEILYQREGTLVLETASEKHVLEEGDFFVVNSNEVHSFSRTAEANRLLVIQLDPNFCKAYYPEFRGVLFANRHLRKGDNPEKRKCLAAAFLRTADCFLAKDPTTRLRLMSALPLLAATLLSVFPHEDASDSELTARRKNLDRLNRILLYVRENYRDRVTLRALADSLELDMYYLSHFIHKNLGISFQEYVSRVRLERAAELLSHGKISKLDLCLESGFSDYRYLDSMFQREFGMRADEYRERAAKSAIIIPDENQPSEIIYSQEETAREVRAAIKVAGVSKEAIEIDTLQVSSGDSSGAWGSSSPA